MNIGHILKTKGSTYFSVSPEQPVTDAVALMMAHRIGSLIVLDGGDQHKMAGIVTERDVLRGVSRDLPRFADLRVRDLMSTALVTCTAAQSVDEAMDLMLHNATGQRIRHLPVVEDGVLLGVISIGDLVEALLTETRFENRLLKNFIKNWPEEEVG